MSLLNTPSAMLRPLRTLSNGPAAAVSQKRFIQNRTVAVQLKQAIKGLGNTGEIVQVNPGRMRRLLFPAGQAIYLPWKRRSEVTKALESRDVIKPSTSTASEAPTQSQTVRLPLSYITSCLSAVPDVLTINSRTSGTSSTLFGSVHTSDVERLLEELDVPVHELEIRWSEGDVEKGRVQSGGRVKETGNYTVEILLKGDAEGKVLDSRRIQVRGVEEDAQ